MVHIDNPTRVGETTGRVQQRGPFTYIEVAFGPHERTPIRAEYLQLYTESPSLVEDKIRHGQFGRTDDLRRLLTFEKLKGCLHDFLYSMDAARIEFHEYQFKPVLKFVNSPTERLLIADEVGLGKTIEAALIWLEMQARHDARRLLVVCPNMIAPKWRMELREKFGIPAEIGTAENLLNALSDLRRRSDGGGFAWICTYSGLRPFKRALVEEDENERDLSYRGKLMREFQEWSWDEPFFDLVIFDEAHYMRNPGSATSKLGSAVANTTRGMLLVTATPVNNTNNDLLTLLRLLDTDFFENESLFNALLDENRPAVQAANHLGARPPKISEALVALKLLSRSSFVGKSDLLKRTIEHVSKLMADDVKGLLEAQEYLEQLNVLGSYVSRTRRVQVKEKRPRRSPKILPVEFSKGEMDFYNAVTSRVRRRVELAGAQFSAFHLTLPQQRMASCIPAVIEAMRSGDFGDAQEILTESFNIEVGEDSEGYDEPPNFRTLLSYDFEAGDSKYQELRKLLRQELAGEKVIIFAYFKGTLRYLFRRLGSDSFGCAMIHGDVENEQRLVEIDRFRDDPAVQVLLSSEVGSEGIDLQFCRVVINYDLPWNPMRVEQRIGRIDRVGQKADRLTIVHFKVKDTIEERLYERLHEKLRIFENSIGDLEAVLGDELQKLTMYLLGKELTPTEEEERIELTRRAIENKLRMMQQLEDEGESLLALSDLIASKVEQNRALGRYVTADELQKYISDFFARNYKGCVLDWESPAHGLFRLELTFEAHDKLSSFIQTARLQSAWEYRSRKIIATLEPDAASQPLNGAHSRPVFVTHLSPLVRWITSENKANPSAFYKVSALSLSDTTQPAGTYVYRIERAMLSGIKSKEVLAYGAYHVETGTVFCGERAEEFLQAVLRNGGTWSYPAVDPEQILQALEVVRAKMNVESGEAMERFVLENDNLRNIKLAQIKNHFDRRRRADERRLTTARSRRRASNFISMLEGNIARIQEREAERIHRLESQAKVREEFDEVACGIVKVARL